MNQKGKDYWKHQNNYDNTAKKGGTYPSSSSFGRNNQNIPVTEASTISRNNGQNRNYNVQSRWNQQDASKPS